jgi:hypothetical protein
VSVEETISHASGGLPRPKQTAADFGLVQPPLGGKPTNSANSRSIANPGLRQRSLRSH